MHKTNEFKELKKDMEKLVGKRVKYCYGLPALSCFMNGKQIKGEGVVSHIEEHESSGYALVVNNTCLRLSEITEVINA